MKWGGNYLKNRVTAPVQAYFYLYSCSDIHLMKVTNFLLFHLFYHPILYTSLVFREVNTHFHNLSPIIGKSLGIVLIADLRHGDVGRLLIFQLKDKDTLIRLENKVYSSIRSGMLHLHIFAKHGEDGEYHGLIVTLIIVDNRIWELIIECLQVRHKGTHVIIDEHILGISIHDGIISVHVLRSIIPDETFREALSYFLIWETEMIQFSPSLISFNGKITTLEKNRNRICKLFSRGIKTIIINP